MVYFFSCVNFSGGMTRKTKVVSKSIEMINISLLITCYLNEYNGYEYFQNIFYLSLIEHSQILYINSNN